MTIPFVDRNPNKREIELFRLILSTYQDGSGQQSVTNNRTLPGWRDFERSVAIAFGGTAQESKYIFDVLMPDPNRKNVHFGISCKMRRTLNDTKRTGRVTLELSNSSGKFWERLKEKGIHQQNYKDFPFQVASSLLEQIDEWHKEVDIQNGGIVDLSKSFYLALSWNSNGEYQLFKFDLTLPAASIWDFPTNNNIGEVRVGRRLRGQDASGTLYEWYGESGGQLKYYPLVERATWKSKPFCLEQLPEDWNTKHGILAKVRDYFPVLWESLR